MITLIVFGFVLHLVRRSRRQRKYAVIENDLDQEASEAEATLNKLMEAKKVMDLTPAGRKKGDAQARAQAEAELDQKLQRLGMEIEEGRRRIKKDLEEIE